MSEPSDPLNRFRAEVGEAPSPAGDVPTPPNPNPPTPPTRPRTWLWVGAALLIGAAAHHLLLVGVALVLVYLFTRRR